MLQVFGKEGQSPIYDPSEFEDVCIQSGATTIFNNLAMAVCTNRQTEGRHCKNKKIVVSMLYHLCFALSQRCSFLQKENTLFMLTKNLNKEAMNTERNLGSTCSASTANRMLYEAEAKNSMIVNNAIKEAASNGWLIVASIDDYMSIHTHRRPLSDKASSAVNMCTIVVSIFKEIPAVPWNQASDIHNPDITDHELAIFIIRDDSMALLSQTYAGVMPDWLTSAFFDPTSTRHRLSSHEYCQSQNVQQLRSFNNLYIMEFKKLKLKGKTGFQTAINWILDSELSEYLQSYCVLLPGDHPAQFYCRQIVYENSFPENAENTAGRLNENIASTASTSQALQESVIDCDIVNPTQGLVPSIGPLHIALNAQETLMKVFHPIFKHVYELVFKGSKLADKPKPWRTSLVLEVTYGGWLTIRDDILQFFEDSRDPFFDILLNLLDTYLPLCLSIYAVSFKLNKFPEYVNAVIRIWTMFLCFGRRHYNKSPLVLLSSILYWEKNKPDLFEVVSNNIAAIDEYRVENTHSIIRGNTNSADSPQQLTRKAKAIFSSKTTQHSFKSTFSPSKNFRFSQDQLQSLKVKAAEVLADVFCAVNDPESASEASHTKSKNGIRKCKFCPRNTCAESGKDHPCICKQHLTPNAVANRSIVSTLNNVIHVQLPVSASYITKSHASPSSSNLDVVAAGILAAAFLKEGMYRMMLSTLVEKFAKSMNDAESLIKLKKDELNGDAITVASLPKILPLVDDLKSKTELQKILEDAGQGNKSLIITVCGSAAKRTISISFFFGIKNNGYYCLESHSHHQKGAVLFLGVQCCIEEFLAQVENLCKKSWGLNLMGVLHNVKLQN
eukprot:Seg4073.2 transcript_id=Seg4073.2/GoldUCD/mRNA.D3Y31 product="hypothetical protein" protein_id=Seg4073.2/GoldUCD/D3Y31